MTDRDAFLRAIVTAPEEPAYRLAFADWLEEQGHTPVATALRLPGGKMHASGVQLPDWESLLVEWSATDGAGEPVLLTFRVERPRRTGPIPEKTSGMPATQPPARLK